MKARLRYLLKSRNFRYKKPANLNADHLEYPKSERRLVTILFADIVHSTEIVRNCDPEKAQEVFNTILQKQISATQKHGGTVNQVMGDGIMCVFGIEAPHEDHALRALLVAQEMLQNIRTQENLAKKLRVKIRVGIHSGTVMISTPDNEAYRAFFSFLKDNPTCYPILIEHLCNRLYWLASHVDNYALSSAFERVVTVTRTLKRW